MHKSFVRVVMLLVVISLWLVGCSSGVSQEQYNTLDNTLKTTQTQLQESDAKVRDLQKKLDDSEAEIEVTKTALADAEAQLLEEQAKLESAEKTITGLDSQNQASLQLIKEESAITAYLTWFDEYYGKDILNSATQLFNARMYNFIMATGDANSITAFNIYLEKDTAYQAVLAALPQDSSAWTKAQYDSWVAAGEARTTALGQVGGHLKKVMDNITWFQG